jgi:hypothetical protein
VEKSANAPLLLASPYFRPSCALRGCNSLASGGGDEPFLRSSDFLQYPNLDASGVMAASAADQISWIKARFAGNNAPNNCH